MFTGIIEERGEVLAWDASGDSARLTVRAPLAASDAGHGDSISVSGVCLTVVDQGEDWFTADVMGVSIEMSTLGERSPGDRVNLERSVAVGDRLGGHIVQGHIDGTAAVLAVSQEDGWRVLRFALAADLAPLVARKGSIAVDGVSLTVSAVGRDWFEVSLIPETLAATTLGALAVGDRVNLETDILARHVLRLADFGIALPTPTPTQAEDLRASSSTGSGASADAPADAVAAVRGARGSVGIYGRGTPDGRGGGSAPDPAAGANPAATPATTELEDAR